MQIHKKFVLMLMVLGISAGASSARAWGPVAHEAIALIAEENLTPKTQAAVSQILFGRRLVDVATWADAIRQSPEWKHTKSYHFTGVPDGMPYLDFVQTEPEAELEKGDVIRAILKASLILRDRESSKGDRSNALAFLTHFVGDLHQPLHTGRREDRGGNDIEVNWFGRRSNLHQVWDSLIIEQKYAPVLNGKPESEYSRIYADEVNRMQLVTPMPRSQVRSAGTLEEWLYDSLGARSTAYQGPIRDPQRLTENGWETTDRLVSEAGFRLAALLNSIFDVSLSARFARVDDMTRLEQQLARILRGDATYGVSLQPASETSSLVARGIRAVPKTRLSNVLSSPRTPSDKRFWSRHGCDHSH
ncbi:MAG: S1/P1 nuclease [Bdellovibrionaceae bacterium]|nr:S1/P1 nuclease [Pseudobdellovibrionaceae bacterium]